jgi:hypothetical protein
MMMEFTQMEYGCTGNVFEQSYKQYAGAIIDKNWITAIWAHLERCEATVKITGLWKPTQGRENDNVIMEIITASGRFKPGEMREINICRLYLQVFFASDITENSGKNLEPWVMKGQRQSSRKSIWEWPVQQIPTAWKAWKQAITDFFCTGRQHAATPRGLARRTPHKAGMVSGYEGTGTMAPNKQQMDTAPSTKHRTIVIRHPRQGRSRATETRTNACRHSDPTALVYRDQ